LSQICRTKSQLATADKAFENMAKLLYLRITLKDQNCFHEEIKNILNSGNNCFHFIHSILSSSLLYKKLKIKIYKNIFVPVVLYGRENSFLMQAEERRLRVLENRVQRRIFGSKREEVVGC
jgi:hypothetical protein